MTNRTTRLAAALPALLLIAGCGHTDADNSAAANQASAAPAKTPPSQADLSTAAEAFETLTEQAFTADPVRLATMLADAKTAAKRVQVHLDLDTANELARHVKDAKAALAAKNRSEAAQAAVEGYRLVVSQFPGSVPIPQQVSLLDYAGFRIQADLRARPAQWTDAVDALAYGNEQWKQVSPQIDDQGLANKFTASLEAIQAAVDDGSLAKARKAAADELALVDELEKYFMTRGKTGKA